VNNDWLRASGGEVLLTLHVQPGAKHTEVCGLHGDALKIRLAAPPVDGKANSLLVEYIAKLLDLPQRQVKIVAGETSRSKRVAVSGLELTVVRERLLPK
jgi:uncharacterized protein (TIGR00251 family)